MKNAPILTAAALACLLLLATAAQAQIYKWVDEKGVTHYTESPPVNAKASKIAAPTPAPDVKPQPRDGPQQWAEKEIEFRKRQLDRNAAEKAEEKKKLARAEDCIRARHHLAYESQPGSFYDYNEKGDKVYRTEAQQAAVVATARKRVDDLCR